MHSIFHYLHYKIDMAYIYKSEHSGYGIYLCFVHLSRYEIIILKRHLVTMSELLVGHN